MRIGPKCDAVCENIVTTNGHSLPWAKEIRYLGIFFIKSRNFKCSFDYAKRSFYRALNAIFGKIGRVASEQVVLELVSKKCIPILMYGLEACPLNKSDKNSIDFALNRFLMKLFNTADMNIINDCKVFFNFKSISERIDSRTVNFLKRFTLSDNALCQFSVNL